jgi:hypothetical protein
MRYFILTLNLVLWYSKESHFELLEYSDVDYTGCKVNKKSIYEICQFLGRSIVSWSSKKQNSVALSTIKTEYVTTKSCCAHFLWMRQTLKDYDYTMNHVPLPCNNESAIKIVYNPYKHFRTKHIDIYHHFLRDHTIKEILFSHIETNDQLIVIFTKLLDEKRLRELQK